MSAFFSVLLVILKIIGFTLLGLIGLLLLLLLIVLFVPVRYKARVSYYDDLKVDARVTYLLHLVRVKFKLEGKESDLSAKILCFNLLGKKDKGKTAGEDVSARVDTGGDDVGDETAGVENSDKDGEQGQTGAESDSGKTDQAGAAGETGKTDQTGAAGETEITVRKETADGGDAEGSSGKKEPAKGKEPEQKAIEDKKALKEQKRKLKEKEKEKKRRAKEKKRQEKERKKAEKAQRKADIRAGKIESGFDKLKAKFEDIKSKKDTIMGYINDPANRRALSTAWNGVKKFFRHILPRKVKGYVHFGLDDPATTGKILAGAGMFYAKYGKWLAIDPDFENKVIEGELYIRGHIRFFTIAVIALKVYFNKDVKYVIKEYKDIKENGLFKKEGEALWENKDSAKQ